MDEYRKYEPIFGSWYLKRFIYSDGSSKVFEITTNEFGTEVSSALKVISLPQDEAALRNALNEYDIMSRLGGGNIVNCWDRQIMPRGDGSGFDVLVRMELLTPLNQLTEDRELGEKDVMRLGIDICKALELCHRNNVVHRGVKPQSIYVSPNGDFKLGDFSSVCNIGTAGGLSQQAGYNYMAPEVVRGERCDPSADTYALGMVMYELLKGNKNPMLAYIINKACAAEPYARYRSAEQMRYELESCLYGGQPGAAQAVPPGQPIQPGQPMQPGQPIQPGRPVSPPGNSPGGSNKGLKIAVIILSLLLVAAAAAAAILMLGGDKTSKVDLVELMEEPVFSGYDDGRGMLASELLMDESKKEDLLSGIKKEYKRIAAEAFLDSVYYTADPVSGLSNGDVVAVSAEYDASLAEEAGIEVTNSYRDIEVSGLEDFPAYLEDAAEFNGHYYKVVNDSMDWSEARDACYDQNGHLATITSEDEQYFIESLIESDGVKYNFWLGGTDEDSEGTWTWITGEPWSYSNWREKQPDNGSIGKERAQNYLSICMVSREDTGRYGKWWDNSDDGVSKNYVQAPYYKDTRYYGYVIEWDGLE